MKGLLLVESITTGTVLIENVRKKQHLGVKGPLSAVGGLCSSPQPCLCCGPGSAHKLREQPTASGSQQFVRGAHFCSNTCKGGVDGMTGCVAVSSKCIVAPASMTTTRSQSITVCRRCATVITVAVAKALGDVSEERDHGRQLKAHGGSPPSSNAPADGSLDSGVRDEVRVGSCWNRSGKEKRPGSMGSCN